jgi:hypothetical protein
MELKDILTKDEALRDAYWLALQMQGSGDRTYALIKMAVNDHIGWGRRHSFNSNDFVLYENPETGEFVYADPHPELQSPEAYSTYIDAIGKLLFGGAQ